MDKAVAVRDVVSPEEYTRNAAQIEQAKLFLAQLEAKNETGRQNFQEELMRKIQEGDQARQLLSNMGQYNVVNNRPVIEFGTSTARIEEVHSNSPQSPQQQWAYPTYAYQAPSVNNQAQYSQPQSAPHYSYAAATSSNAHNTYSNEYLPSVASSYSTPSSEYATSYGQQAYASYGYPTQAAGLSHMQSQHHSSYQASPPVSAPVPRKPTHRHQELPQNIPSSTRHHNAQLPMPPVPPKPTGISAKVTSQPVPQPPGASTQSPSTQPSNQTKGSSSSSTSKSTPMHGRQSILEFRDAVFKWAGQAPPNAYIDVSGVRVLKDSSSMIFILTNQNGSLVKQTPNTFFEEMLARLASTGSRPPTKQPTVNQQHQPSSTTSLPQAPSVTVPSAKPTVNRLKTVASSTAISGLPKKTTVSTPSGQSVFAASAQTTNVQVPTLTPQPHAPKPVVTRLPISAPQPAPLPVTTDSLKIIPQTQTTPPPNQYVSIPVTPGLAQRQRTFVNGSWRSPQDANKSRLAKDLLTALGKRKPNANALAAEQPAKRPTLEFKRVDISPQSTSSNLTTVPVTTSSTHSLPDGPASSTNVSISSDVTLAQSPKVLAPQVIQIPLGPVQPPRPPQPSQHRSVHSVTPHQPDYQSIPVPVPVPVHPPIGAPILQAGIHRNVGSVGQFAHGVLPPSEGVNPYASLLTPSKVHKNLETQDFVQGASQDGEVAKEVILLVPATVQETNKSPKMSVTALAPGTESITEKTKKATWQTVVNKWSKDAKEPFTNKGVGDTASASNSIQLLEPMTKSNPKNTPKLEKQQLPNHGPGVHQDIIDLSSPDVASSPRVSSLNDTTEPLFLPSPTSSIGVPPSSEVSESSVPVIIYKGKSRETRTDLILARATTKAAKLANKKKSTTIYVLVPPAPKYLVDYREWEVKRANKTMRREQLQEQDAGGPSSAANSRAQSVTMSMDVARMDETEDFSYAIQNSNVTAVDPDEQKAIELSCSRLQRTLCRWAECNIVLNSADALGRHLNMQHKPEPTGDQNQTFICRWTQCGRQSRLRDQHVEKHASLPLVCAFEDTFRSGGQLLRHFRKQHAKSKLKPTAIPLDGNLMAPSTGLPYQPLPANMFVTAPVRPKKISPERHQTIGPWIVRNIMASDQDIIRKPKRSKKTARTPNSKDPYPGAGPSNNYEFLTTRTVRYASYRSEGVDLRVQNLDSAKISEEFDQGLTLWAPENRGVTRSVDHYDAEIPPNNVRPLSEGVDGDSSRPENDEDMVEDMLVRTNSPEL
ncbi:hypothetical protein CPB83DRAFT_202692 [Crepidotus variabilis]|uniref:C2H2-type domain-containing protein n=1 Tax=Crepidotus variabilis TaxID=179855 RepID=A0A9P6ETH8_9AGAR|nr:hypothetical protein CPB83DRAFT_202692 [Crepidotus variabilis]